MARKTESSEKTMGDGAPDFQKPHWSASSLGMALRCWFQFMYRYLEGIKFPPGVAMVIGGGVGKGVDADMECKMETGQLLDLDQVQDAAAEGVRVKWLAEGVVLNDKEKEAGEKVTKGKAVDQAVALSCIHHNEIAPGIEPAAVEKPFRVVIDDSERDLLGYKDIVEVNGTIRDTKTSGKKPADNAAKVSIQMSAYALDGYVESGMTKIPETKLDYLVKTKKPYSMTVSVQKEIEDLEKLMDYIKYANKVVETGAFTPAAPDHWVCSERFCGYWNMCPFGARQRVQG